MAKWQLRPFFLPLAEVRFFRFFVWYELEESLFLFGGAQEHKDRAMMSKDRTSDSSSPINRCFCLFRQTHIIF